MSQRILKGKFFGWVLLGLSVVALLAGVYLLLRSKQAPAQPAQATSQTPAPSSEKPKVSDIDNYKVAADLPRYIYIPPIGIAKTRVTHLDVSKANQIISPSNIYDVGWYIKSAKPGQAGAMFIYGHISSWTANGIFYNLKNLKFGDQITIERGDGKKFVYAVQRTKIYQADAVDMGEVLAPTDANTPGLNLMTCAGKVKPGTSEFTERLVVFASLVT